MKYVHSPSEIPEGIHYVILNFSNIYIPGDERSRTNPGHGYPESTETKISYCIYDNKEKWEKEIEYRMTSKYNKDNWKAIIVTIPKITKNIEIKIN